MKCPWCEKEVNVPDNALINAENYGRNFFYFKHKCGNDICVYIRRVVKVDNITRCKDLDGQYSFGSAPI
jgi:hypothetical protein